MPALVKLSGFKLSEKETVEYYEKKSYPEDSWSSRAAGC
jgi:hypothetical protein